MSPHDRHSSAGISKPARLQPLPQPPEVPDYNEIARKSAAKSDADIKAAEAKVEQLRAGTQSSARPAKTWDAAANGFDLELDWRGEAAYYLEPERKVWLFASYWGGPVGHLEHVQAEWEYAEGRREKLSVNERSEILRRAIRYIREQENITVIAKELANPS